MRDGIELFCDLYRPAKDGRPVEGGFPTILHRGLSSKEDTTGRLDHHFFVKRGYTVVLQDIRGRFKSGGTWYHGATEVEDGYDTIEWIAKQPWSNGKVGMTGVSYQAAVQTAAALAKPPHFSSMFHVEGPVDYYQDHYRRGGALNLYCVANVFLFAASAKEGLKDPALARSLDRAFETVPEWVGRWPLKKGLNPLSPIPDMESWLLDPMVHTDYDEFYKRVGLWQPKEYLDVHADIPGYYVAGWYDLCNETLLYTELAKWLSKPMKLLMGPWVHNHFERWTGDVDFGPEAAISHEGYNNLQLAWFDQTLNGRQTGILDEPPVKIFVMGGGSGMRTPDGKLDHGGSWRFEDEWPIARTRRTPYYLREGGALAAERGGEGDSSTTFTYDPADPVPTIGTTYFFMKKISTGRPFVPRGYRGVPASEREMFVPYGPYDQREDPRYFGCSTSLPLSSRHDVVVFQTPPLGEDVEVTGPVEVRLWGSSSAVDTDFTAKLIDAHPPNMDYPDGYAMGLTDSLVRASYRDGFAKRTLMTPGTVYEFTIMLPATSNLFRKGHRIRVDISSSNHPDFDINPNTGDSYYRGRTIPADNTIYHSLARPSHVVLPIIPSG